jgi:hypothetical protein
MADEKQIANKPEESLPDSYRLRFPIEFGDETIEELKLRCNGKAMKGFKVMIGADGGVVFEPYAFAELGLRLANQPRAIVDRMHPCDQFGLGMVALGFFIGGPETGRTPSEQ